MVISDLFIKRQKRGKIERIERGILKKDCGLVDDVNAKGGYRQVSIISKKNKDYLDKEDIQGLCTKRFYGNLIIEGLEIEKFSIGQKLIIGETVQEITSIGKRCFSQCNLLGSNIYCPLKKGVVFTKVIRGGIVKEKDNVSLDNHK